MRIPRMKNGHGTELTLMDMVAGLFVVGCGTVAIAALSSLLLSCSS